LAYSQKIGIEFKNDIVRAVWQLGDPSLVAQDALMLNTNALR